MMIGIKVRELGYRNKNSRCSSFAKSIIGSSHIRNNTICQDSSGMIDEKNYSAIAVSDGHGSSKHFRSKIGSQLAVSVALEMMQSFVVDKNKELFSTYKFNWKKKKELKKNGLIFLKMMSATEIEQQLIQLEKSLVFKWRQLVERHYNQNPFTNEETANLSPDEIKQVEDNVEVAYGATVLCACFAENITFGLQLGDGDIIAIESDNKELKGKSVVEEDSKLAFGRTTSLCNSNAHKHFRHFVLQDKLNGMLLSTDGVANSYKDGESYVASIEGLMKEYVDNQSSFEKEIGEFLAELTKVGSGDDVSIAIVKVKK